MKRGAKLLGTLLVALGMAGCTDTDDGTDAQEGALFGIGNSFTNVGVLQSRNLKGEKRGHGQFALHKGLLVTVYGVDSGKPGGGFAFVDIKDPRNPKTITQVDSEEIREPHGYGFARIGGRDIVALQAVDGATLWDWSDVRNPKRVGRAILPGIEASDYDLGAWWCFFQGPYLYVAGSRNGLYVVDVKNPESPRLLTQVSLADAGVARVGSVFVLGNLAVLAHNDGPGYATLDVSDPAKPRRLASQPSAPHVYSAFFNGNRIYGIGVDRRLHVHDVSDPLDIRDLGSSAVAGGKGGYGSFQDGFVLAGFSDRFAKIDVRKDSGFEIVGKATSDIGGRDEDFATPIGNLVIVGDDHGVGSAIFRHTDADRTPPEVNRVHPPSGAKQVLRTARVGLSFTDAVDFDSVNESTVQLLDSREGRRVDVVYSSQTNLVNLAPVEPLHPNTRYDLVVSGGGLRDYAGNAIAGDFRASFETGD